MNISKANKRTYKQTNNKIPLHPLIMLSTMYYWVTNNQMTISMGVFVFILFHCSHFFHVQWCLGHNKVYGSTMLCCRHYTVRDASAKLLHLCFWIYCISRSKTKSTNWRENEIICGMIYAVWHRANMYKRI